MFCKAIRPDATLFVSTLYHSTLSWAILRNATPFVCTLWRKTRLSIIWPCHSFISYAILQLILTPSLYLLIYLTSLYFWWWRPPISFEVWNVLQGVFLFTMLSFLRICSSVKHARLCTHRHITVFIILHPHTTFNQDLFSAKSCLMSFV